MLKAPGEAWEHLLKRPQMSPSSLCLQVREPKSVTEDSRSPPPLKTSNASLPPMSPAIPPITHRRAFRANVWRILECFRPSEPGSEEGEGKAVTSLDWPPKPPGCGKQMAEL